MTLAPTALSDSPAPLSTPDLPATAATNPWAGLTEDDATRITAALAATHAASTRKVYGFAWRRWVSWCAGREIVPFPAEPAAVCAYLTECAEQGLSLATIDSACSAIGHQHRSHGVPDPVDHDAVRQVRRGLRRIIGRAPRRPTRPLSVADVRQIVGSIDRTTERGVRDTALLLLGFAGALRRSKTDQEARGQVVGIAHGQHGLTDPVAALDAWLAIRGTAPGPVSPASDPAARRCGRSPATPSPPWSRNAPSPPGSPAAGSAATRCAPGTPRAPPSPASASSGSPPRPGTAASTSSSTATSAPSTPCRPPRAATSDSDPRTPSPR